MKTLINSIFFAFLLILTGSAQNAAQIEKLMAFEKYSDAKKTAVAWVQSNPNDAEACFQAGKVFAKLNSLDTALTFFNKGLSINPDFIYNNIGVLRVKFQKNDLNGVNDLIEKLKDDAKKKDIRFRIEMADAFIVAPDDYKNQISSYTDEAIKLDRKDARIYMVLGDYYNSINDATKASENFQKAIDYDKNAYRAYVERAMIYERVRNYSEADTLYHQALEIEPTYPIPYEKLGEMYSAQQDNQKDKNYQQAVDAYSKYVALAEPSLSVSKKYAYMLYKGKMYSDAVNQLKNVIGMDPKDPANMRLLAYAYARMNDSTNAMKSFETFFNVVEKDKANSEDYERYGKLLLTSGKDSLGAEMLLKVVALDSTRLDIYKDLGTFYKNKKQWKKVEKYYDPLVAAKSGDLVSVLTLGMACYFDSSYQKAVKLFELSTTIKPTEIMTWLWYSRSLLVVNNGLKDSVTATVCEKFIQAADVNKYKSDILTARSYLGFYYFELDNEKAKENWQKVLELDPTNAQAIAFLKQKTK
jgi:tetratricopeptide (TPR) repeat protein